MVSSDWQTDYKIKKHLDLRLTLFWGLNCGPDNASALRLLKAF